MPSAGGVLTYMSLDVPQVQFAAKMVMAEASRPTPLAEVRLRRAARYLVGNPITEWHYPLQELPTTVVVEADSDWAGSEDAKSTQCTVMMFGEHCLEVTTSTQGYVATSSGVAELLSLNKAGASAILVQQILELANIPVQAVAGTDSSAAKGIAHRVGSGRVRHLRIQDLWIQERVRQKEIKVEKLDTATNRADIGTKYLDGNRIETLLKLMGLDTRGRSSSLCVGCVIAGGSASTSQVLKLVAAATCVRGAGSSPVEFQVATLEMETSQKKDSNLVLYLLVFLVIYTTLLTAAIIWIACKLRDAPRLASRGDTDRAQALSAQAGMGADTAAQTQTLSAQEGMSVCGAGGSGKGAKDCGAGGPRKGKGAKDAGAVGQSMGVNEKGTSSDSSGAALSANRKSFAALPEDEKDPKESGREQALSAQSGTSAESSCSRGYRAESSQAMGRNLAEGLTRRSTIAPRIAECQQMALNAEQLTPEQRLKVNEIMGYRVADIRIMLRQQGLSATGLKVDLARRLAVLGEFKRQW